MNSKILKKIFAILIIVSLVIPNMSTVLAATTEALKHEKDTTAAFGITILGPDNWGYNIGGGDTGRIIYRTYRKNGSNSEKDYSNAIYCLSKDKKFPTEKDNQETTGNNETENYKSLGDFSETNNGVTINNKDKIKKIIDVMYIKDSTDRKAWLKKILVPILREKDTVYEEYTDDEVLSYINDEKNNPEIYIYDDDIFMTQQLAIWHFTEGSFSWPGASLYFTQKENSSEFGTNVTPGQKAKRDEVLVHLYNYLISSDLENSSGYKYMADTYTTKSSIWQATDDSSSEKQPLLYVSREEKPKKYDAALTKSIVAQKKAGESKYKEVTGRTPTDPKDRVADKSETQDKEEKTPLEVSTGDKLVYKITVYNQGDQKVRIKSIRDHLPQGIEVVSVSEGTKMSEYASDVESTLESSSAGDKTINEVYGWTGGITEHLKDTILEPKDESKGWEEGKSCLSVLIECKVTGSSGKLKNYAEITEMQTEQGNQIIYGEKSENKPKEEDSTPNNYLTGTNGNIVNEDDTDYEIVEVKGKFDLSLKKYVSSVNGKKLTEDRENKSKEDKTTQPVTVSTGDLVIFTIKVTNEGTENGYVTEIKDHLPKGLGYLPTYKNTTTWNISGTNSTKMQDLNIEQPSWFLNSNFTFDSEDSNTWYDIPVVIGDAVITADTSGGDILEPGDTKTIQIACIVTSIEDLQEDTTIKNIAEISGHKGEDDNTPVKDVDSTPDNHDTTPNEDDEDFDILKPKKEDEIYDLALQKFISQINGRENDVGRDPRDPQVSGLDALKNGTSDDAIYTINDDPVQVKNGDKVTFTIRVYNEGNVNAKALEITDTIPEGLEFDPESKNNNDYGWKMYDESNQETKDASKAKTVKTTYLSNQEINAFNGEVLAYKDVKIDFIVNSNDSEVIKNLAKITEDDGEDRDDEDTEDEDSVIPSIYDLALQKFVSQVNGREKDVGRDPRNPEVSGLEELKAGTAKNAVYTVDETPVKVKKGDKVTFTIRVYNEGNIEAHALEITDTIPEGLEFDPESENNKTYEWKMYDKDGKETENKSEAKTVKTTYLADKTINPLTGERLDYKDVKIDFTVTEDEAKELKNVATITEDDGDDRDPEDTEDEDSVIPSIYDLAIQKFVTEVNDSKIEGREPKVTKDEDGNIEIEDTNEPVTIFNGDIVTYTIRVYNVGNQDAYAARITDDLPEGIEFLPENETNKEYKWVMYKEAENEEDEEIVEIDGKTYVEVEDIEEADIIATDYLSKDKDEENLIKAFDKNKEIPEYEEDGKTVYNPDYKDIKVAFKVIETNVTNSDRTIINTADVPEVTDKDGNPVPDENEENNDDKEYIELRYFDLSLLKYVSKVIVTEDGKTKETDTGYDGTENPEPMVKVEINRRKINTTTVKYVYTLKVINEGEIEGFAQEITDIIPAGMAFYAEDNKEYGWEIKEDGVVATNYLTKTLLKPGESAEVQITLRWENSETNLGQKVNVAEITSDYNEYGAKDVDSTPNNNKDGEDDQDEAIAMLSIGTGRTPIYIGIIITTISILAIGGFIIKKYVL